MARHFAILRWLKGLLPAFIILCLAMCAVCLVWISTWGLPASVRTLLEDQLRRQGVEVEMSNLRVSFWGGVVLEARDVVVHNRLVPHQDPSSIERLRLDLDMEALWEGRFKLDRAEIVDGRVSIPLGSDPQRPSRQLDLEQFNAVLSFDAQDNIDIREAQGILQGMKVTLEGKLLAGSGETTLTQQDIDDVLMQVDQAVAVLDEVEWLEGGPPVWNIRLADTERSIRQTRVAVEMEAPQLTYRGLSIRDVILDAEYTGNFLSVKKFMCREMVGRGKLDFVASADLSKGVIQAWLRSEVPLFRWVNQVSGERLLPDPVRLKSVPTLIGSVRMELSSDRKKVESLKVQGRANVGSFDVNELQFDRFSSYFSYQDGDFYITDMKLSQGERSFAGQVMKHGENLTVEVQSTLAVTTFFQLYHAFSMEQVAMPDEFDISGSPEFYLKGRLAFPQGWENRPKIEFARVLLKSEDISLLGVGMGSVTIDAEVDGKNIAVRQCTIRQGDRQFDFNGQSKDGDIYFTCTSNIKPSVFERFFGEGKSPVPPELKIPENADFHAKGILSTEGKGAIALGKQGSLSLKQLQMKLTADDWAWRDLDFKSLAFDMELDGAYLTYGSLSAVRGDKHFDLFVTGDLKGDVMATGRTTVRLDTFDRLLKLDDDDFFFERFKYTDQSAFDISFMATANLANPLETYKADAIVAVERTQYNGVMVKSASAAVHVESDIVTLADTKLVIDHGPHIAARSIKGGAAEGQMSATRIVIDFNKDTAAVEGLQSRVYPDYATKMFSDKVSSVLSEFTYYAPVSVSGSGLFPMGDDFSMMKASLAFSARGTQIDYKLLGTTLQLMEARGNVSITPDWVHISRLGGSVWGGVLAKGLIDIQIDNGDAINGVIDMQRMNLAQIGRSYGEKMNKAEVDVSLSFKSKNGNVRTMTGLGWANLRNGNLVEIPIFGKLGELVGSIPGVGQLTLYKLSQARCDYHIGGGYVRTDLLRGDGENLSLKGSGSINLETLRVNANLQLNFKGLPKLATLPVYILARGLFRVRGSGPLSDVDWSPAWL